MLWTARTEIARRRWRRGRERWPRVGQRTLPSAQPSSHTCCAVRAVSRQITVAAVGCHLASGLDDDAFCWFVAGAGPLADEDSSFLAWEQPT